MAKKKRDDGWNVKNVPTDTRQRVKMAAVIKDETMGSIIVQAVAEWCQRNGIPPVPASK